MMPISFRMFLLIFIFLHFYYPKIFNQLAMLVKTLAFKVEVFCSAVNFLVVMVSQIIIFQGLSERFCQDQSKRSPKLTILKLRSELTLRLGTSSLWSASKTTKSN